MHKVEFKRGRKGNHKINFTCLGDEGSKCHNYPDCDCDYWTDEHIHPKKPHADCWLVSWFENNGQGASYYGDDAVGCSCGNDYCPPKSRTGLIEIVLEDQCVMWEWV